MHGYIPRMIEDKLNRKLKSTPAIAILGPRQCGKTTLAKRMISDIPSVYLDLQRLSDLNKINEPELFFERHREELVCLDEIQASPGLFSYLRSEIDNYRKNGRFLILGSASRDLVKQSSETLAGRIAYLDLTPFLFEEVKSRYDWHDIYLRGGFPNSLLAENNTESFEWREDFIRTFLERDIPVLGFNIPSYLMGRLWRLLAHYHGKTVNYSKIANTIDISQQTLKKYMYILEQTYMIRLLKPYEANVKKRLIKSPKIYIRDPGILHSLLEIESFDELLSHPVLGASWEGFCIENIIASNPGYMPYFFRTANGAEIDLIIEKGSKRKIFEFKFSKSPTPSRGFFEIFQDIKARDEKAFIISPVDETYEYKKDIFISGLNNNSFIQS